MSDCPADLSALHGQLSQPITVPRTLPQPPSPAVTVTAEPITARLEQTTGIEQAAFHCAAFLDPGVVVCGGVGAGVRVTVPRE